MISRSSGVRLLFALLVASAFAVLVIGYITSSATAADDRFSVGKQVADPREGMTVITTDSNSWLGQGREGTRSKAEILAIGPEGRVQYYNDSHTRYWDVDPVPGTERTVEYVAADHLSASECGGDAPCTRNVVERVNLSTGEMVRVFARITSGKHSTRWHDVDRIDEEHVVVADIAKDRVFIVNTTSGITTWAWNVQTEYPVDESGGSYPGDWTHLNDVEVLDDGRIMVSLRNQDQVVFLDRKRGLLENRTLGSDDARNVLYEQHNPDYVPTSRGGPAVLVADSENNRLVEYRRNDDEWVRTWTWQDDRLQWPRDADRLPNGHTLVTDSNGDRVFEIDKDGTVVWTLDIAFPYEAERLGTGDESTGGPSAREAGLAGTSDSPDANGGGSADPFGPVAATVSWLVGSKAINGVIYVTPVWVGALELGAFAVLLSTVVAWSIVEVYWSPWRLAVSVESGVRN